MISLWPAIDLMGGEVVRLLQGDPSKRTVYPERPADVARRFAEEGADGMDGLGESAQILCNAG